MPPRKSTESRKSDASTARFALKEGAIPQHIAPAPPPSSSSSLPAASLPTANQTQDAPDVTEKKGDKDQEKDKEAKEKEKEKDKDKDKDPKGEHKDATTIEELTLPKSIITRLAKGVLPPNTQIQGNAILALSKSTTVFINYLATYANEHTVNAGKKTILPNDVFKALEDTEFGFLKERLEAEFAKFSAIQTEKRTSYRNKVKAAKQDGAPSNAGDTSTLSTATDSKAGGDDVEMADTTLGAASDASGPRAKKARIDPAAAAAGDEHDDAETEDDEEHLQDEDEEEQEEEEDDDENDGASAEESGDETQDAIEERNGVEEHDEALDGDESD
uniref:DNA polymerase epsilon subunit D n=1 Tax=Bionectria ochroleuca TaxID=29856 RepID=A0A8H7NCZ6_BIOOC